MLDRATIAAHEGRLLDLIAHLVHIESPSTDKPLLDRLADELMTLFARWELLNELPIRQGVIMYE